MYARRVSSIEISGIRKLFEAMGKDSIDLGLGQPDFDTPAHIKRAAIEAIEQGRTGYTSNAGIEDLRVAICEKLRRENQLSYSPEEVIVTAGASEALHIVMQALVNPGDRVVIPDPGFVSYPALTTIAEGRPIPLGLDESFHIDPEMAKVAMDGARLFILNSPSNPTGAVEDRETIKAVVEYADDRNITVITDEVYEHFVYEKVHVSPARFGENVVTINAASKTYAMTGWRLGFLAARKEVIEQCLKVHQYCQACASSISQYAALAAYKGPQDSVMAMREEYRARRDLLYNGLRELGIEFPLPEGAFYAFAPLGRRLVEKVLKRGVVVVPGVAFGKNASDHVRISYAASRQKLELALERIRDAMGDGN